MTNALRPVALLALALLFLPTVAARQTPASSEGSTVSSARSVSAVIGAPPGEEPMQMFSWAQTAADLGEVVVPGASAPGWSSSAWPMRWRSVPSFTSDPTYEVVVAPPLSGHPVLAERFLLQMPANFGMRPLSERAVVVAYHSWSTSEKQVFLSTDLPQECAARGWMLFAPYGLRDTNFANVDSQASCKRILEFLYTLQPFDSGRVYGVGFSMGALNALSFGMRHLDPGGLRFAGIVAHTPTVDVLRAFAGADPATQAKLANPWHFGAGPDVDPFAYERISPARVMNSGLIDDDAAPALNLLHIPVYLHVNLADPNAELVQHALELSSFLTQRGGSVTERLVNDPVGGHTWGTMSTADALDTMAPARLPAHPKQFECFADRPGRIHYSEVLGKPDGRHARFQVEVSPLRFPTSNAFAVRGTRDLDQLLLRVRGMGLDPLQPFVFDVRSVDGTEDVIFLDGLATRPQAVSIVDGGPSTWSWDSARRRLRVDLSLARGWARVTVTP